VVTGDSAIGAVRSPLIVTLVLAIFGTSERTGNDNLGARSHAHAFAEGVAVSDIDREPATQVCDRMAQRNLRTASHCVRSRTGPWARQTGGVAGQERLSNRVPFDKFSCCLVLRSDLKNDIVIPELRDKL
jgi:hypothetical protein